jgi:N-acetylneuraminic acid mutarotase
MYVVGEGRSDTYVYNISGRVWADNAPTRPYPGDHHGVAVVGTDIYLVGGFNGGPGGGCAVPGCQGQMQVFRTATREWETLGSLPYVVEGSVSAVTLDGKILACSGLFHRGPNEEYLGTNGDAGVNPTDCFQYDPSTQGWSRFASMLVGVDHAASGTDGVKMYVFGGRSIGRNIAADGLDLTQVYDPATDTWSYGELPGVQ